MSFKNIVKNANRLRPAFNHLTLYDFAVYTTPLLWIPIGISEFKSGSVWLGCVALVASICFGLSAYFRMQIKLIAHDMDIKNKSVSTTNTDSRKLS